MTLLALFILEETFSDLEDEWQLIASKAIEYLERVGVTNSSELIGIFTVVIKDE